MLKLIIVGRRRGGMTLAQLHRYMIDVHGAAVVGFIGSQPDLAPRRYVQNHIFDGSFRVPDGSNDPLAMGRDFVTQVWFDNPAQAQAALEAPFYLQQLRPDEDRFVDQGSVLKLPVAVRQVLGADKPAGGIKLFVFHRLATHAAVDSMAQATLKLWQSPPHSALPNFERLERNQVMTRPGEPSSVDWIDEAWLADESAAHAWATFWLDAAATSDLAPWLAPQACMLLMARERVMFAGCEAPCKRGLGR